jgi:hypothetical protein
MKLYPQDLQEIARLTLEHYNQRTEEFWKGTRDHSVSQQGFWASRSSLFCSVFSMRSSAYT